MPTYRWANFVAIFLGAFLLFQIQPLIAKIMLPWFGGSPALWAVCMLFFQSVLLAGYAYAHFTTQWLSPKRQGGLHCLLLIAALAVLPVHPSDHWVASAVTAPTRTALAILATSVGLPFFILSTTSPLIQHWWSRMETGSPYRLYALSNAGSLLALFSYPFVVEPAIGTTTQATAWTVLFVIFSVGLIGCGVVFWRTKPNLHEPSASETRERNNAIPTVGRRLMWVTLSASGSVLLLTITNHICSDVAVVPFLWTGPLCLYLLSFILCFGHSRWYHRGIWGAGLFVSFYGCGLIYRWPYLLDMRGGLAVHLAAVLAGCMVCHGEMVRLKPASRYLTAFYLHVAAGGAIGGVFVALLAPLVFQDYFEYPLTLCSIWLLFLGIQFRDTQGRLARGRPIWVWAVLILVFANFGLYLSSGIAARYSDLIAVSRNFYGVLSVNVFQASDPAVPRGPVAALRHGRITHGSQYIEDEKQDLPTEYYTEESALGLLLRFSEGKADRRIGAVGLGAGTIAAYGKHSDVFRFYEINPDVVHYATNYFTFLPRAKDRGVTVETILGDARISLSAEEPQEFDVLVLDAFSGDAIPVHLVTREAFDIYLRHLRTGGVIAMHITNEHVDLLPMTTAIADHFNLDIGHTRSTTSEWVLLSHRGHLASLLKAEPKQIKPPLASNAHVKPWTDDFSNLFEALK